MAAAKNVLPKSHEHDDSIATAGECLNHTSFIDVQNFDFRRILDNDFGNIFPAELYIQAGILEIVEKHHQDKSVNCDLKSEILLMDVLHYLCNHSFSEFFLQSKNLHHVTQSYRNDMGTSTCEKEMFVEDPANQFVPRQSMLVKDFNSLPVSADGISAKEFAGFIKNLKKSASFPFSNIQRRYYYILCRLGMGKYVNNYAFKLPTVSCTFKSLSESLRPFGHVDCSLMSAYCGKLLLDLNANSSKKYYFPCFVGEAMIERFKLLWNRFINYIALPFPDYQILYPPTPKQKYSHESGVFVLKFIELWDSPRVYLPSLFSHEDICSIRIVLVNEMFFSPLNMVDITFVQNIYSKISAAVGKSSGAGVDLAR
ncbi:hypothetical protein ACP70R_043065 [Stipagrostis hirtigluma subsp. patula]